MGTVSSGYSFGDDGMMLRSVRAVLLLPLLQTDLPTDTTHSVIHDSNANQALVLPAFTLSDMIKAQGLSLDL